MVGLHLKEKLNFTVEIFFLSLLLDKVSVLKDGILLFLLIYELHCIIFANKKHHQFLQILFLTQKYLACQCFLYIYIISMPLKYYILHDIGICLFLRSIIKESLSYQPVESFVISTSFMVASAHAKDADIKMFHFSLQKV